MSATSGPGLVALLAAAGAAALLVAPARALVGGPARVARRSWLWMPAAAAVLLVVVWTALVPVRRVALVGVLLAAGAGLARLRGRRRHRSSIAATRLRVLEVCEELSAELAAGRTAEEALGRAAAGWPPLEPAARAQRLSGDVPAALRAVAAGPGAGDLVPVAAAWHVAHRTGEGLADAVGRVAVELRARRSLRRVVDGELASARATSRLVAALPAGALLLGSGAGGSPWRFLLDTPAGVACLAAGIGLALAGLAWIEAIAAGIEAGA